MEKKLLVDEYLDYHRELVAKKIGEKNIVLLENGMFYEMYNYRCPDGPDLFVLADLLNIQLARRNKEILEVSRSNYEMVGFPIHAQQKFINILLQNNYTVAIYVQQDVGKTKKNRVLDQIISPSTSLDYCYSYDANYLMCIYLEPHKNQKDDFYICAYSFIDLSVGDNYVYETSSRKGDFQYGIDKLYQVIKLYNPKEILLHVNGEFLNGHDWIYTKEKLAVDLELDIDGRAFHYRVDSIPKNYDKVSFQNAYLGAVFPQTSMLTPIEYLDLEKLPNAIICYMLLLDYAKEHKQDIIQKISRPKIMETSDNLILTQNSAYQLNIIPDKNMSRQMSLLNILNNCSTAFGKRHFKERLLNPLVSSQQLEECYEKVENLKNNYKDLEEILAKIADLERLFRRLALKILAPMEFANLHNSNEIIVQIYNWIKINYPTWINNTIAENMNVFTEFMVDYCFKFDIEKLAKYNMKQIERSIFLKDVYPEIDNLETEINISLGFMDALAKELSSYIEIPLNSKNTDEVLVYVSKQDRDGYYLELTKKRYESLKDRVKGRTLQLKISLDGNDYEYTVDEKDLVYETISSANKNIRIVGKPIKRWSNKIDENSRKINVHATEIYLNILEELYNKYHSKNLKIVEWIAELDILKTHAKNAILYNLVRPKIVEHDQSFIRVRGLRHPIVEQLQTKTPFIANDITLGIDNQNLVLCYGYNAVGKTTKQKAICISIIMAQIGGFVSAQEYEYQPYRYIFTRISNVDNLLKNQSSFMVEMIELKYILKHADKWSMICIDELVASTERLSGISLVASTILELNERGSSMFMATHLHELSKMSEITSLEKLKIYHLEVHYDEKTKTLIYDRKLRNGPGTGLYGLEVACFLELNPNFMDRAFRIRNEFLGTETQVFNATQSKYNKDLYLLKCENCDYKPIYDTDQPLETHHINFQCNADANGNFGELGFHKDVEHNLVSLCRKCHQKVHSDELEIVGYQATGTGAKLQIIEKTKKKLLANENIETIKKVILENSSSKKKTIIEILKNQYNITMDYKRLAKIQKEYP